MCLLIEVNESFDKKLKHKPYIKVSKKDIKVWKRFELHKIKAISHSNYILLTPYQGKRVSSDGDIMTARKFTSRFEPLFFNERLEVDEGIHAYTNLTYAQLIKISDEIVLECIIPAGTPYIEGKYNEICALQLIVPPIKK